MSVIYQRVPQPFITIQQGDKLFTQYIFENHNKPKPIVFIIGKSRTGKSTLLNSVFGTNFPVSNSIEPQTKSSIIHQTQKFIVIDVEGFGTGTSTQIYNRLLIILLLISDITIFNSSEGTINQQQIRRLGLLLQIITKISPLRKRKCSLVWLIQNFYLSMTNKQGENISEDQYLIDCLQSIDSNSDTALASRKNIRQYFQQKICKCLPPKQSTNYDIKIEDLKQELNKIAMVSQETSLSNNICFLNFYLVCLVKQVNMLAKIQNCTLDLQHVIESALMQLVQQKASILSLNQDTSQQFDVIQFCNKYLDIELKRDTIVSIQRYQQTLLAHLQIQSQFQNKLLQLQQPTDQSLQKSQNSILQPVYLAPIYLNKNNSFDENINMTGKQQIQLSRNSQTKFSKRNSCGSLRPLSKKNILKYVRSHEKTLTRKNQNQEVIKRKSIENQQKYNNFNKENMKLGTYINQQQQTLIHKLKKIITEQQQSYRRRLNISKKYINRLENQQEIIKKQLMYANKTIHKYQQQFEFLKNIQVFQCWKCLEKINDGILNHMKVCCGPLKQQLQVKILSVFKINNKTHFVLEIKVIPTKYRKWQITKKLSQLKNLEKVLAVRYNLSQVSKQIKDTKGKIKKNNVEEHIQTFLNTCCKHLEIQHDQTFKDFIAGVVNY